MAAHDKHTGFSFVDAHSKTGRDLYQHFGLDPDLMETNIVILHNRAYTKMASFTAAISCLGWPWKALVVLNILPAQVADWLYDRIARNRYRIGRRKCPLPSAELKGRLLD